MRLKGTSWAGPRLGGTSEFENFEQTQLNHPEAKQTHAILDIV